MITLEKARQIDPEAFKGLSDKEAQEVLDDLNGLAELAFEKWIKEKNKANAN